MRRLLAATVGVALVLVAGCAGVPVKDEVPPPMPPAPAAAERDTARPPEPTNQQRLGEQLSRIATELSELQNAVARLIATSRQHEAQFQSLDRRLRELAALNRDGVRSVPRGFAPSGPTPSPAGATPMPTVTPAEELYQAGQAKFLAKELDAAVLIFYDLIATYPSHPLREAAQFVVADIYYGQKDVRGALAEFEALLAAVPDGSRAPDALLKIGLCQRALADEAKARRTWERLVKEYPNTPAARQARALLRGSRPS